MALAAATLDPVNDLSSSDTETQWMALGAATLDQVNDLSSSDTGDVVNCVICSDTETQ